MGRSGSAGTAGADRFGGELLAAVEALVEPTIALIERGVLGAARATAAGSRSPPAPRLRAATATTATATCSRSTATAACSMSSTTPPPSPSRDRIGARFQAVLRDRDRLGSVGRVAPFVAPVPVLRLFLGTGRPMRCLKLHGPRKSSPIGGSTIAVHRRGSFAFVVEPPEASPMLGLRLPAMGRRHESRRASLRQLHRPAPSSS